jgi:hypothetical protein
MKAILQSVLVSPTPCPAGLPRPFRRRLKTAGMLVCCGAALVIPSTARAVGTNDIVAVSARVSDDYQRTRLPSGSFQPETYTFGPGGHWGGAMRDDTIDKLKFIDVARTIAVPLTGQNYLPAKDPSQTKLLIMVYWGTTVGTGGAGDSVAMQNLSLASQHLANAGASVKSLMQSGGRSSGTDRVVALTERQAALAELDAALSITQAENRQREQADLRNARMLGYNATGMFGTDYGQWVEFTALRDRKRDLVEEIADNRYFVVLMAYDFQLLWKEKKHKLLWETRFSIRERNNDFGKVLAGMTQYASRYFGQDSHGLLRKPLPEGHVTLGKLEVGEVVPDK